MEGSSIHNYKIDLEAEEDLPATQIVEEDRVLKSELCLRFLTQYIAQNRKFL